MIYKPAANSDSPNLLGFLEFWSFLIILNTLVPISLYVSCVAMLRWRC